MRGQAIQALKNRDDFKADSVRTEEAVAAMKDFFMVDKQRKELVRANKWATWRSEIKNGCSGLTDEEVSLYECMALTSWESR